MQYELRPGSHHAGVLQCLERFAYEAEAARERGDKECTVDVPHYPIDFADIALIAMSAYVGTSPDSDIRKVIDFNSVLKGWDELESGFVKIKNKP